MNVKLTLKWILALGAATVFVVAVALVLVLGRDADDYGRELANQIETRTGRSFSIDGDVGLKLSLVPTLTLAGVHIGNAPWGSAGDMISIEQFEARLAVVPLLKGEFRVKRIVLSGVTLQLETDRRGRGNWLISLDSDQAEEAASWRPRYDLESALLDDVVIEYRPHGGDRQRLDIAELKLVPQGLGRPLDVTFNAAIEQGELTATGTMSRLRKLILDEPFSADFSGRLDDIDFTLRGEINGPSTDDGRLHVSFAAPSLARLGAPLALDFPDGKPVTVAASVSREGSVVTLKAFTASLGGSTVNGDLAIEMKRSPWRVEGQISSPHVVASDVLPASPNTVKTDKVFSQTPLSFDALRHVDARIDVIVRRLDTDYAEVTNLGFRVDLDDRLLDIDDLAADVAGGELAAKLRVDAKETKPAVAFDLSVQGASLERLRPLAADRRVAGGAMDLKFNIKGSGVSVDEIMAGADGLLAVDIGSATLNNQVVGLVQSDLAWSFISRLNPMRDREPTTRIECVVVRFPIADGLASNTRGIGILTQRLSVLGGGTMNLRTEAIDLGAQPKPREGVGLTVSGIADFMRLGGTLKNPAVSTNAAGVAIAGAKVGAAVATVGLSVVAEGLYDRATSNENVCETVRDSLTAGTSKSQSAAAFEATKSKTKAAARRTGEAIKGAFKNLFGK